MAIPNEWAQEIVQEELTRRVAVVGKRGKEPRKSHARLLEIGLEELRERSKKYDNVCESDEFSGQRGLDTCLMCHVHPPLRCSTVLK